MVLLFLAKFKKYSVRTHKLFIERTRCIPQRLGLMIFVIDFRRINADIPYFFPIFQNDGIPVDDMFYKHRILCHQDNKGKTIWH